MISVRFGARAAYLLALALLACGDDGSKGGGLAAGGRDAGEDAGPPSMDAGSRPTPPAGPEDAGRDTGAPAAPPDSTPVTPEEDGGTPSCRKVDCSSLDSACTIGVCDEATFTCRKELIADFTPCGNQDLNTCTAPDRCESGVCVPRHTPRGTACGDQNLECRINDECDGNGNCEDKGVVPANTPCGNATPDDPECDAADTCNATGACVPNHTAPDTACGDQGLLCRNNDFCDGLGHCSDQGFWTRNNCPPGVPTTPAGDCVCGRGDINSCHPVADICSGAVCVLSALPNGTPCGSQASGECDSPDQCINGYCEASSVLAGTPCGSDPTNTTCNRPDACDGYGTCSPNYAPATTACGPPASVPCYDQAKCNGNGGCGSSLPTEAGEPCGSESDSACDNPDTCNGSGVCQQNHEPGSTTCGAPPGECELADTCNSGACTDNGPKPQGDPCGDPSSSECDQADACNGSGACTPRFEPPGTVCGGPQGTCMADDTCDGGGLCLDRGFAPGCSVPVTGTVTDQAGSPLEGLDVSIVGGAGPQSTVTDANGAFALSVDAATVVLVHIESQGAYWGALAAYRGDPSDTDVGTFALTSDTAAASGLSAPGVDPIDTSLGLMRLVFFGATGAGGEGATLSPACMPSSCGPIAFNDVNQPVASASLLPGGLNALFYVNVPLVEHTPSTFGSPGLTDCSPRYDLVWPTFAHTAALVDIDCGPP